MSLNTTTTNYRTFWTDECDEISKNLLCPIDINSGLNQINFSLLQPDDLSLLLTTKTIEVKNNNPLNNYYPTCISTHADNWDRENIPSITKTFKIKLSPSSQQRKILTEWMHTSRYVYNKAVARVNKGESANFYNLRDALVTEITRKENIEYIDVDEAYERVKCCKKRLSDKIKESKTQLSDQIKICKNNLRILTKKCKKTKKNPVVIELDIQKMEQLKIQIEALKKNYTDKTYKSEKHETMQFKLHLELLEKAVLGRKNILQTVKKTLTKSKNPNIQEWELETPKDVRAGAVEDVCKGVKSAISNLKAGNIEFFHLKYKKKNARRQCIVIPSSAMKNTNGVIQIYKTFLKDQSEFKMGKRTIKNDEYKNLKIECDCRIVKEKREYWLFIPVIIPERKELSNHTLNYCGVDPGVRTLMTIFGNNGCTEYTHKESLTEMIDKKIKFLKASKTKTIRVRRRKIDKMEKRKKNVIDEIHWKSINKLLKSYDIIFFGDIKSHNLVKGKENHNLNRRINNVRFYQLKQKLLHKSIEKNKHVVFVKEHYTTKICSFCGKMNDPKSSKIYKCEFCKKCMGRDENASKNILIKGIAEWKNVEPDTSSAFIDDVN